MTYQNAKRLHNEDEVIIKSTGNTATVIDTVVDKVNRSVTVNCDYNGYSSFTHKEIS